MLKSHKNVGTIFITAKALREEVNQKAYRRPGLRVRIRVYRQTKETCVVVVVAVAGHKCRKTASCGSLAASS